MSDPSLLEYERWSRDSLVKRIKDLELMVANTDPNSINSADNATKESQKQQQEKNALPKTRRKRQLRSFDFNLHPKRQVVFLVAYLGWPYQGFAAQAHTPHTVEHYLFEALVTGRLVEDIKTANYSRCGRTDKGVSATGNAFSACVRSAVRQPGDVELPYITMMNRLLPDHIRVLAWAPVPDLFSARFSCTGRTYKYFFPAMGLDIPQMQQAVAKFVGIHDFRNFCKIDPNKPERNYERTILAASIEPVDEGALPISPNDCLSPSISMAFPHTFYTITIKGTAFLWHQIRCMAHLVILIGQKLEQASLIDTLLDVVAHPQKPQYDTAPELPLVFWKCNYDSVQWRYWDDDGKDYFPDNTNTTTYSNLSPDIHINKKARLNSEDNNDHGNNQSENDTQDEASAHFYMAISGQIKHFITMYEAHKTQTLIIDRLLKNLFEAPLPKVFSSLPSTYLSPQRDDLTTSSLIDNTTSFTELYPYALAARPSYIPWGVHGCIFPITGTDPHRRKEQKTYTPIMSRPKCDSVADKNIKLTIRQQRKETTAITTVATDSRMVDDAMIDRCEDNGAC